MKNGTFAQINVRVQPEIVKKAKALSKSLGLPLTRIVADAITAYHLAQTNPADRTQGQ